MEIVFLDNCIYKELYIDLLDRMEFLVISV